MSDERLTIASVDPCEALAIQPAVFSKAKTVKDIAYHIRVYPAQRPLGADVSSDTAFKSGVQLGKSEGKAQMAKHCVEHTLEFTIQGDTSGRVGTLYEIQKHCAAGVRGFFIYPLQGDGLLLVQHKDGAFEIEDGFGEGWDIQ